MGFGPFSSDSTTRNRVQNVDNAQTVAERGQAIQQRGGGKNSKSAQADGGSLAVQGNRNTVTVTNNLTDAGAVAAGLSAFQTSAGLLGRTLDAQSNLAVGALQQSAELAQTKVTDGANLTSKNVTLALVVLAALAGLVFLLKR